MIIREAPVDNAWYRASVMWFIGLLGINCLAWPALDYYNYTLSNLWFLACPIGSIILWFTGKFISAPKRVTAFVLVIGLFGYLPLMLGLLLPLLTLLVITRTGSALALPFIVLLAILSGCWVLIEVRDLRINIIAEKFLEREFAIGANVIYLNRRPTTDLDATPARHRKLPSSVAAHLSKLVLLVPSAYPLQRLLSDTGGAPAVLLLLSILATPFAVYVLGSMSRGFYLWIYVVRRLEREHGKPVILQSEA